MTRWTEEQRRAIALTDRRLLISAAAGSGKTAVLTERIVAKILDLQHPVDIDQLLIMTFTRAAAAEMRERIRCRIEDRLQQALREGQGRLVARAKRELAGLDAAYITTIDSFCLTVLREHADRLPVDPAFRVGSEEELRILKNDVLEELLEEQYEQGDPAFLRFAEAFSQGKADFGIGEEILALYQFAESLPWSEEWLERCEAEEDQMEVALAERVWARYMAEELRKLGAELCNFAEEAQALCEEGGLNGYESAVQSDLEKLIRLREAADYPSARRALAAFGNYARLGRNKSGSDPDCAARVKESRNFWKKALKKPVEAFGTAHAEIEGKADAETGAEDAETVCTLVSLARDFAARFRAKKREKNLLDFSDLEHEALALFWKMDAAGNRHPSEIAREYQAAFQEIYVDEYQDSNGVQEELLRAIETGRLFLVGDVKQSIYGFRHAKPELFAEKYQRYQKDDGSELAPGIDTRVDLRKNFRSREEVLASCNAIFSRLMREELEGVRYDADAALYPGAAFPAAEGSGESYVTELLLVERDTESEEAAAVVEAETVAARIQKLLDPEQGLKVSDGAGGLRPVSYGDMAILLRATSGQAERFVEVLMSHGIPALAEQKTGYFDAPEVRTVLSLLRAIDNPFRDIPLAAVLHAPIGGLSEEELAFLAAKGEGVSLYERLEAAIQAVSESKAARKTAALFQKLDAWREAESYLELPQFLRLLYTESGYQREEAARPGGELRYANLQMLIVKAEEFESIGYRGLSDFVRYIDNLKKYNADYGAAQLPGEEAAAVRIMTVHKSKGLEFPVVFFAGLSKRFNQRDMSRGILYDQKLGIAADAVDYELHAKGGTEKKAAFAWHLQTEVLGEELRVLYVAMTRAREKLILVAGVKENEEALPDGGSSDEPLCTAELRSANCYLDWILAAMARDSHQCRIALSKVSSEAAAHAILTAGEKVLELREVLRTAEESAPKPAEAARFIPLTKPYSHAEDVSLQVKRSASELKRLQEEREEGAALPLFSLPQDGGSEAAVRRGTAYHKLFERIDFTRSWTEDALRAFLEELTATGALLKEDRALLSLLPVVQFLQSRLAARLAKASRAGNLHRETSFVMAIPACEVDLSRQSEETVVVQGVIDAWFEEEGHIVLLDYKTDKAKEEAHYREKYTAQLALYARALQMTEKKAVTEKLIYSLARGEVLAL